MQQLLDFFVRVGDVTLGAIFTIIWIGILIMLFIELIDFLIVDPIKRSRESVPNNPSEED